MTKEPLKIPFYIKRNQDYKIEMRAISEGNVSPCTVTLKIKGMKNRIFMNASKDKTMKLFITGK